MESNQLLEKLCAYDKRNPDYAFECDKEGEKDYVQPETCFCDNCFYGRTELAEFILSSLNPMGYWYRDELNKIYDLIDNDLLADARTILESTEKLTGLFPELQEAKSMLDRLEILDKEINRIH